MKYTVKGYGRLVGAIGRMHPITHEVEADSPESALLKTYDTYDHLSGVSITPICPNCGQWQTGGDCLNQCKSRGFA